ncbi:DUF4011 domain-containing protein, partial [Myxococcota bacterium]|nr:DUF4011 domain-containing protein [Myxococcota bacterium]
MNGEVNLEVEVEVICDGFVNAAMQHNGVPFIRQVSITTTANVPEELELAFTFTPRIAEPVSISLPPLGAAKTLRVDAPLIVWDGQALAEKTEREIATMTVSIGSGGTLLWSRDFNFAILAWNEWSGLASLPQLLGAFVQPNHPAIFEVVTLVRDALKQATGDPALMGYQFQDKERVNAVVSAVFASLSALSITYVTAAPSFEDSGQKVRLPEQILLSQMGNCLDLSLFVCGILEHVGLNPLVIVTKEHAMAGCWTVKKNFSQGSMDDLLHLQKLEELGDVLLFDVTAGLNDQTPFSEACEAARVHLIGTVGAFCVIDIKAGRREQILALPSRTQQRSFGLVKENKPEVNKVVAGILERMDERSRQGVPLPLEEAFSSDLSAPKMKRVENWKEKLLDLSLRNRLLNYRESGKSLILECALSAGLEDELACGSSFRIVSRQQTVGVSDPRSAALVEVLKDEKAWHQVLAEAQSRHELLAPYSETELARRLREIAREARVSMEESGANMLFLGLGFLNWKENPRSDQIRQAPLVLLPVQLTRKSMRDAFQLSHLDEDPAVNITLIEKLKKDFGIDLSIMCDPPKDEKGLDISAVFEGFRRAILPLEGWSVSEALCLGLFSFTKFLMWRDLSARSDQLMKGVVAQLAADVRVSCADGEFPDVASLDDTINPQETFCPLSADSSQLAAILAAAQGKSFILEGPPGTGKSQTITNLITHCLASGKKVLFVSEKMAALEVVQHRLKQVGLGRFCLELHSQKAQKRQVLDELGRSLAGVTEASPTGWDRVTTDLSKRRQALNNYARELHRVYPAGLTYYRAISRLSVLRDVPRLSIDFGEDVHALDESSESLLRNKVAELVVKIAPLAPIAAHPLQSVRLTNWAPGITESCATQCDRLLEIAGDLTQSQEECASVLAAPPPQTIQEVRVTGRLVDSLMVAPGVPGTLIDRTAGAKYAAVAMRLVEQEQQQRDLSARVDSWFTKGLWELDLVAIAQKVQRWAGAFFLFAFFALFFTRRKLRSCSCPGRLPGNRELADRLSAALTLMKLRMTMEAQKDDVLALGPLPSDAETRWRLLEQGVSWVESFHSALREWSLLPVHGDATDSRVRRVQELVTADFLSGPPVDAYKSRLAPYSRAVSELELCEKALDTLLCMEGHVFTPEVPVIPLLETMSREYRGALPVLRDWALCQATLGEADEMGLGPLVARLRDGRATPESAMGMYERALCTWFVDHIATAVPALGRFHGKDHQRLIDEFNALDQEILRLTCEHVVAKLSRVASSAPNDGNETSEPGILIAQVKKKRGNLPLRVLFDRIRGLLLRIKPCFLMSPLS